MEIFVQPRSFSQLLLLYFIFLFVCIFDILIIILNNYFVVPNLDSHNSFSCGLSIYSVKLFNLWLRNNDYKPISPEIFFGAGSLPSYCQAISNFLAYFSASNSMKFLIDQSDVGHSSQGGSWCNQCWSFHQGGARFVTVSIVTSVNVPSIILDYDS